MMRFLNEAKILFIDIDYDRLCLGPQIQLLNRGNQVHRSSRKLSLSRAISLIRKLMSLSSQVLKAILLLEIPHFRAQTEVALVTFKVQISLVGIQPSINKRHLLREIIHLLTWRKSQKSNNRLSVILMCSCRTRSKKLQTPTQCLRKNS